MCSRSCRPESGAKQALTEVRPCVVVVGGKHMVDVGCGGEARSRHGVGPDDIDCLNERSRHESFVSV